VDGVPADWRVLREDELGMFEISVFLAHHLGEAARARADGWEGDRYALLAAPDGDVLFWRSVWESTGHADAFAASVRDIARRRAGRNIIVRREDGAAVLVIDAPAGADISAIEAGQ